MPDSIDLVKAPGNGGAVPDLVPKDMDYNNVFGTYAVHVFQNFTKIFQTDVNFFVMVPRSLLPYYYYIVLQQLFWYRGYVPGVHNSRIISQQLGGWICDTLASLTISGGFHIETEDEDAENGLTDILNSNKVVYRLGRRLPLLNAGGFMLAYTTCKHGEDTSDYKNYNLNFVDCNRHFAKLDMHGRVVGFVAHLKSITPDPVSGEMGYYLIHRRWLDKINGETRCLERYSIYQGPAWITTPTFQSFDEHSSNEMERPPEDVLDSFQNYLGDVPLNVTTITPFVGHSGASIIHNSQTASGVEEYQNFSNGTLYHIINQLYEFELTKAQKMVNKYMAVTKVLLPDNFYSPPVPKSDNTDPDRYQAVMAGYHASFHDKMGHNIFKRVPYITAEEQTPFFFQAKNESETYNKDIKFLLSEIAAKIHISAHTLAPFISEKAGLNQKTAEEINVEENETRLTISDKRELISQGLNTVFEYILQTVKGKKEPVQVIFNNEEVSNPIKELNLIGRRLDLKLTSHERALARANRHLSKREIKKLAAEIESDIKKEHDMKLDLKKATTEPDTGSQSGIPEIDPNKGGQ